MTALSIVGRQHAVRRRSATGSCSARAPQCSCSRSGPQRSAEAPRSSARSSARPATPTPTTSPPCRRAAPARSPACDWRLPTPGSSPVRHRPDQRPRHVDTAQRCGRGRCGRRGVRRERGARSHRPRASPVTHSALPARSRRRRCCCRSSIGSSRRPPERPRGRSRVRHRPRPRCRPTVEAGPSMSNNFGFGGHNGTHHHRPGRLSRESTV